MIDIPKPMPQNLELDLHLFFVQEGPDSVLEDHLCIYDEDMSKYSSQYTLLAKKKVVFEIDPDLDLNGIQVEKLREKKKQVLATAERQARQIDQQIQSLLAIEHKPEVEA